MSPPGEKKSTKKKKDHSKAAREGDPPAAASQADDELPATPTSPALPSSPPLPPLSSRPAPRASAQEGGGRAGEDAPPLPSSPRSAAAPTVFGAVVRDAARAADASLRAEVSRLQTEMAALQAALSDKVLRHETDRRLLRHRDEALAAALARGHMEARKARNKTDALQVELRRHEHEAQRLALQVAARDKRLEQAAETVELEARALCVRHLRLVRDTVKRCDAAAAAAAGATAAGGRGEGDDDNGGGRSREVLELLHKIEAGELAGLALRNSADDAADVDRRDMQACELRRALKAAEGEAAELRTKLGLATSHAEALAEQLERHVRGAAHTVPLRPVLALRGELRSLALSVRALRGDVSGALSDGGFLAGLAETAAEAVAGRDAAAREREELRLATLLEEQRLMRRAVRRGGRRLDRCEAAARAAVAAMAGLPALEDIPEVEVEASSPPPPPPPPPPEDAAGAADDEEDECGSSEEEGDGDDADSAALRASLEDAGVRAGRMAAAFAAMRTQWEGSDGALAALRRSLEDERQAREAEAASAEEERGRSAERDRLFARAAAELREARAALAESETAASASEDALRSGLRSAAREEGRRTAAAALEGRLREAEARAEALQAQLTVATKGAALEGEAGEAAATSMSPACTVAGESGCSWRTEAAAAAGEDPCSPCAAADLLSAASASTAAAGGGGGGAGKDGGCSRSGGRLGSSALSFRMRGVPADDDESLSSSFSSHSSEALQLRSLSPRGGGGGSSSGHVARSGPRRSGSRQRRSRAPALQVACAGVQCSILVPLLTHEVATPLLCVAAAAAAEAWAAPASGFRRWAQRYRQLGASMGTAEIEVLARLMRVEHSAAAAAGNASLAVTSHAKLAVMEGHLIRATAEEEAAAATSPSARAPSQGIPYSAAIPPVVVSNADPASVVAAPARTAYGLCGVSFVSTVQSRAATLGHPSRRRKGGGGSPTAAKAAAAAAASVLCSPPRSPQFEFAVPGQPRLAPLSSLGTGGERSR